MNKHINKYIKEFEKTGIKTFDGKDIREWDLLKWKIGAKDTPIIGVIVKHGRRYRVYYNFGSVTKRHKDYRKGDKLEVEILGNALKILNKRFGI